MNVKVTVYDYSTDRDIGLSQIFVNLSDALTYVRSLINLWVNNTYEPMDVEEVNRLINLDNDQQVNTVRLLSKQHNIIDINLPLLDNIYGLYTDNKVCKYICVYGVNNELINNIITDSILRTYTNKNKTM